MTPVDETAYVEFFRTAEDKHIFLLQESVAKAYWHSIFPSGTSSYFDIPNEHWIASSGTIRVCEWISAYNANEPSVVEKSLRLSIPWTTHVGVRFCVNHSLIFQTTWTIFLRNWNAFLGIHDDCPIVLPNPDVCPYEAIVFTPLGDILFIQR